ncbi:hypothetical protein CIW64_06085 [Enterobacter cloacae]|nr:hypothetical protein [Enterobacter sichuanensis]PAN92565.1 hypothetical protein CIW64_06085 [Enterobacter cloacae]
MITLRSLAAQYGYDESTVRQWKANGMPIGEGTEEADTRAWIVQNVILPLRNTDTREQIDQERLRKLNIRGTIFANSGVLNNVTINENCNILGTLSAARIVGDQCRPQSTGIASVPFIFGSHTVSGGQAANDPVAYQHYVALRIRGEDFDRILDSNMTITLTSFERQYFYIRMGGDGIGLTNLAFVDAGNNGHNTPYTFPINGIYVPAVGRGKWNYIYVMCTTSRSGLASLNVPPLLSALIYRAGEQPLYNA